jgi:ParB/RepB/Spo0J family partition protein
MISIDEILVPEERMTAQWKPDEWERFVSSIRERGILQPLTLVFIEGKVYLVDGYNRMLAAKELGIEQVPCIIKERIDEDVFINNVLTSMLKGRADPVELGKVLMHLTTEQNMNLEDAAKKCVLSATQARKYIRLVNLPTRIQSYVSERLMGIEHAYSISQLRDPDVQLALADDAVNYRYNIHQTREAVAYRLNPERDLKPGMIDYSEGAQGRVVLPICEFCGEEVHPEAQKTVLFHSHCWPIIREAFRQQRALEQAQAAQVEAQSQPQPTAPPTQTAQLPVAEYEEPEEPPDLETWLKMRDDAEKPDEE